MSTNGDAVSLAGSNSDEPPPANEFHGESVEKADEGETEITDRQSTPLLEAAERYQVEQTASNEEAAEVQSPGEPTEENWSDKVHQLREELAVARSSERTLRTELEYITDLVRRTLQDGEQQAERCLCDHLKLQCRNLVMRAEAGRHDISRASMSPEQLVHLSMRTLELDEMLNQHRMYLEHQPMRTLSRPQSGSTVSRPMSRTSRPASSSRRLKPHVVIPTVASNPNRPHSPAHLRLGPIGRFPDDEPLTVRDILATPSSTQMVIPITTPTYWACPTSSDVSMGRNEPRDADRYEYDPNDYRSGLFSAKGLLKGRPKAAVRSAYRPPSGRTMSAKTFDESDTPRQTVNVSARINIPSASEDSVDSSNVQETRVVPQLRLKSANRKQLSVKFNDLNLKADSLQDDSARMHEMERNFKSRTMDLLQRKLGLDEHGFV